MTRTTLPRAPKTKSLEQQKSDFTSEGSPPPGKVDTSVPAMPGTITKTGELTPATVHGIRKRQPSVKGR